MVPRPKCTIMIFQHFWFRSFLSVLFYIWLILDPAKLASTKLQLKWFMGSWIWVVELLCDIKYRIEMIPSDDVAIGIDCKGSEILVALYIMELKVASAKAWSHFDWITFLRFPINRAMMMHCIAKKSVLIFAPKLILPEAALMTISDHWSNPCNWKKCIWILIFSEEET